MPKYEIFDHSDFHDFYTIKSLWEGGGGAFGIKIIFLFYLGVKFGAKYAQSNFKKDFLLNLGKKLFCGSFEIICQ